jgi:hypothetical protein
MVSNKITHIEINAEVVEENILLSLWRNRETKSTTNKDLKKLVEQNKFREYIETLQR